MISINSITKRFARANVDRLARELRPIRDRRSEMFGVGTYN